MRRQKVGLNGYIHNASEVANLTPLGYLELVPGDTMSGLWSLRYLTDYITMYAMNRGYIDVFAFYVPFRVLDDDFPDFLMDASGTLPTASGNFAFNFEKKATSGASHTTDNIAWLRYCYNTVWNKFFRAADEAEAVLTSNTIRSCRYRPSTFHESVPESAAGYMTTTTIDTSGATTDVDTIRNAFNADAFNKARAYYGDRYVDYLRAVGVQASWSILDEPELIAKRYANMKFRQTHSETDAGDRTGRWEGQIDLKIPKFFAPEHGLFAAYAVVRIDQMSVAAVPPMLAHENQEDYWSPERDSAELKDYTSRLWTNGAHTAVEMPRWEHLLKGYNMTAQEDTLQTEANHIYQPNLANVSEYKDFAQTPAFWSGKAGEVPGTSTDAQVVYGSEYKLAKYTAVGTSRLGKPLR